MGTDTSITEGQVLDALRQVIDPELGINLVDLGLIYGVAIDGANVRVTMTLTTPGCPMHDSLVRGAERALARVSGIASAHVELVWDPPWNPDRMAPGAMGPRQAGCAAAPPRPGLRVIWPASWRLRDENR